MIANPSRTVVALLALGAALSILAPSANAQHCEIIKCERHCWRVGHGQCRCATRCLRRCWRQTPRHDPPAYVPEAERDYKPRYVAPVQHWQPSPQPVRAAKQPIDPSGFLMLLGGAAVLVLLIAAAATRERAVVDGMHKKTDEARTATARATALANKATSTADEIDTYIAARRDEAYRAGRNSLPETGHD